MFWYFLLVVKFNWALFFFLLLSQDCIVPHWHSFQFICMFLLWIVKSHIVSCFKAHWSEQQTFWMSFLSLTDIFFASFTSHSETVRVLSPVFQAEALFGFIDATESLKCEWSTKFLHKTKLKMVICLHKLLSDLTVFFHPMLHSFILFLTFLHI